MDTYFPRIFHLSQICLGAYNLYLSSVITIKLRRKEDLGNKAAKWSSYVDHQMKQVKATQASAALSPLLSLLSAAYIAYYSTALPSYGTALLLSIMNSIALTAAHNHVRNFWKGKAHLTFAKDFSDAMDLTNYDRKLLAIHAGSWVAAGLWYALRWLSFSIKGE